ATRQRQKQAVHPQQHGLTSGAGGLTYIHASYSVTHLLAANVMPESAPDRRQLRRTPVGTVPTRPRDSAAVRDRAATLRHSAPHHPGRAALVAIRRPELTAPRLR